MGRLRSRRTLLASIAATAAAATGGFEYKTGGGTGESLESGTVPPERYDCSDIERPEPDAPDDDAALEPREYPSPPSEPVADGGHGLSAGPGQSSAVYGASRYVTEFERAYRRNAFVDQYRTVARSFELRRTGYRTVPVDSTADGDAVLVAIIYDVTKGTRRSTVDPRSEWDVRVVYYLDDRFALRSRYNGVAEELAFDPDPRTHGTLVACFD